MRDSGRRATEMEHLSLCELCEQNLKEDFFAGKFVGNERKALSTGISLHGGSVWQPGMSSSSGDFDR